MKKVILFAIAVTITTIASAQIEFGAKAGLNLATISVSPKPSGFSYGLQPSFYVGGLVYIPLFSKFGLQPEIMYSGQGTKQSYQGASANERLGYINIPVLFKYKDPSGFFAEAGPQIGILLTAKEKVSGSSTDFKDQLKTTDVAFSFGAGYLSSLNIGVDARFNLGLTNIIKDAADGSAKNTTIQVGVFYVFGGSKK